MASSTSACPPRLHLSIPSSTTSFKRSFEQFGFDLDSPTSGGEPGSSAGRSAANTDRRDRNKRARSASSLSVESTSRSSRSSTAHSGASDETSVSNSAEPDTFPVAPSSSVPRSFLAPPRIPTPVIQDVDMPDYQEPSSPASETEPQDHFHSTLARFSEFDSNISALRSRSPSLPRSPTPPPVLPPLSLSGDTAIQVPDIEEPVAFNYRDLLGSSTHLQHGSSTQTSLRLSHFPTSLTRIPLTLRSTPNPPCQMLHLPSTLEHSSVILLALTLAGHPDWTHSGRPPHCSETSTI
ncbi:hypothetical protein BDZ89DRAFT_138169 [Hymenopellis radicata]|nr:hypothetical protein BDZ89DRAFT_138169 [Hymenopellis radicata]